MKCLFGKKLRFIFMMTGQDFHDDRSRFFFVPGVTKENEDVV